VNDNKAQVGEEENALQ